MVKTLTSQSYEVNFKSGKKLIVSDKVKEILDKALDVYWADGKDAMLKMKDGSRIGVSQIIQIRPIRRDVAETTMAENMKRILSMMNDSAGDNTRKVWCDRVKANLDRIKKGKRWIYYDRNGNECSKEQAKLSIL